MSPDPGGGGEGLALVPQLSRRCQAEWWQASAAHWGRRHPGLRSGRFLTGAGAGQCGVGGAGGGQSEAASLPFLEVPSYLQMRKCPNRVHTIRVNVKVGTDHAVFPQSAGDRGAL